MADYTAREWSGGDIVTAANLNHLEQGVESAQGGKVLIIDESTTENDDTIIYTLNKTWQEIHDAMISGIICLIHQVGSNFEGYLSVSSCAVQNDEYYIYTFHNRYTSINSTDYPIYEFTSSHSAA